MCQYLVYNNANQTRKIISISIYWTFSSTVSTSSNRWNILLLLPSLRQVVTVFNDVKMNLCMRVMSVNCSISMCVHVCAAPRQRGRSCVKTNSQTDLWDRDEPAGTREGMRACVCILCVLVPVTKNGFHGIDLSDMWRTCGKLPWRHTRRGCEGGRDATEPDVRMLLFSFYQRAVSLSLRRKGRNKLKKKNTRR